LMSSIERNIIHFHLQEAVNIGYDKQMFRRTSRCWGLVQKNG